MRPIIESLQNPRIKQVVRLREAATRRKLGRFLIDGWREIELASRHGVQIETIFVDGTGDMAEPSASAHPSAGVEHDLATRTQAVSSKVLERIGYGQRSDTPVAVAVTPQFELRQVAWEPPQVILVLDRTEKPGNLGACLRTAAAAGVSAVILTDPICEPCNPNTIRASRGSLFTVPLAVTSGALFRSFCAACQLPCFAARVDAAADLWQQDFSQGGAVLFGSEAHGLGPEWYDARVQGFTIPMQGTPDSLNLSISTALTLYEAVRQQRL